MIWILLALLFAASVVLLGVRRSREAVLVCGLVLSLCVFFTGLLLYIAKKGGIGPQLEQLFYLNNAVRVWLQYRVITLGQLGYLVAVGRYTFPLLLMLLALHYTLTPSLRWLRKRAWLFAVLPLASLVVYWPPLFRKIAVGHVVVQRFIVIASKSWIAVYLILACVLLIFEYFSTTISFMRRRYLAKAVLPLSLTVLYALYFPQDPAQIYLFYSSDYMWLLGLWYLNPLLSIERYIAVMICTAVAGFVSFASLLRRTQISLLENREQLVLSRKFDAANMGVSVFVHSTKNQLLADRILHKRMDALLQQPQPDIARLKEYVVQLSKSNEEMLARMDELYQTVRAKNIYMKVVSAAQLAEKAAARFYTKYPTGRLEINVPQDIYVLADASHMAEALYNLLTNGWEATSQAGGEQPLHLSVYQERLYTVFEVADHGPGIPKEQRKKIFEPFYSSKNSRYNWGMGLYYVHQIVTSHMGHLRLESREGKGTNFLILLPRYIPRGPGEGILPASCHRDEVQVNDLSVEGKGR